MRNVNKTVETRYHTWQDAWKLSSKGSSAHITRAGSDSASPQNSREFAARKFLNVPAALRVATPDTGQPPNPHIVELQTR